LGGRASQDEWQRRSKADQQEVQRLTQQNEDLRNTIQLKERSVQEQSERLQRLQREHEALKGAPSPAPTPSEAVPAGGAPP
jgi:chromosome segregation ATPase